MLFTAGLIHFFLSFVGDFAGFLKHHQIVKALYQSIEISKKRYRRLPNETFCKISPPEWTERSGSFSFLISANGNLVLWVGGSDF